MTCTSKNSVKRYVFACDGSYKPNRCGWALCRTTEGSTFKFVASGIVANGTNNIGEMTAMIETLKRIKRWCPIGSHVTIKPDSQYVILGMIDQPKGKLVGKGVVFPRGWIKNWLKNDWLTANKQPVKNKKLWLKIIKRVHALKGKYTVDIEWIKGHVAEENYIVDVLAKGELQL